LNSAIIIIILGLTLREERRLNVSENRVPRNIFEPKSYAVTGEWGRPHNAELNELYASPNILVIKSRKIRWAWHVTRKGRGEVYTGFWWGSLKERNHLEDSGIDVRIILMWISRTRDGGIDWIDVDQDRNRWQALVKAVMNLRVRKMGGIS